MFTLHIASRDYTEWVCENAKKERLNISPHKLFHGDQVDASGNITIASAYRTKEAMCGVLLTSQKTYGRKGTKLLYKCVPDDEHLPCFLIPYEEKTIGFDKTKSDNYITFKFKEWTTKHPIGLLTNTFGKVEDMEAYVGYQMACKDIGDSLKTFNAASLRVLREYTLDPLPLCYNNTKPIEDRRQLSIISIDPIGCMDIDDALGIRTLPNGDTILSIYIANVPLLLEYLQLWPYVTERVSTIYLPTTKYPMLPVSLSENMFSLKEKEDRIAFVMDIKLTTNPFAMPEISYTSTIICVEKNYAYGAPELIVREDYKSIFKIVQHLNDQQRAYVDHISSSHDVVEYCMLRMNHECAKILNIKKHGGIFRSAGKKEEIKDTLAPELKSILQNVAGEYSSEAKPHELLGLECYTHITSPIRRIVDIVNMMNLIELQWSADAIAFMAKWQSHLAHINNKTKAIRRLQNEMELMTLYEKNPGCIYNGVVFQRSDEAKGLYKYRAYIPETKMLTSVFSMTEYKNYAEVNFSAHLFLDEAKMTKKIRLQIL